MPKFLVPATVRGRGELGARLQPRGKYEAVVYHLGATADREEKKDPILQIGQFQAVVIRGFGPRKQFSAPAHTGPNSNNGPVGRVRVKGIGSGTRNCESL